MAHVNLIQLQLFRFGNFLVGLENSLPIRIGFKFSTSLKVVSALFEWLNFWLIYNKIR